MVALCCEMWPRIFSVVKSSPQYYGMRPRIRNLVESSPHYCEMRTRI
ncbi:hypothetical protein [Litchfieldia alkalitelluris]|nr:hypothetical protein [Litchfieldia alkalitelluris]